MPAGRAFAKLLDGIHHVRRLIKKGFAELRGPFEILIHPFHYIRIANERFYAVIPGLILGSLCWIAL